MKLLLLCTLVAAAQAGILYTPGLVGTGASAQYRHQDSIGNYNFGYDEGHFTGGTFRRESGDAFGNKAGSYGLKDADGRVRVVNYVADAAGYRADISSNELGVEPKDPASASINKGVAVAAPAAHAVTYAAAPALSYVGALPAAHTYSYTHALPAYGYHYAGYYGAYPYAW
ncbi:cuticle protein 14-like [Tachypleus tridentatus]|uniref:cuticle protein 14-like n=1 Tax=Tachypleus tridentatus TaxID=6853 RepID=UPI003FD68722